MFKSEDLKNRPWWNYLEEDLQDLLTQSILLSEKASLWEQKFHDYSFVVFPAAKAYEGFLKKAFLDSQLITKKDFFGKRFRIGKALNPNLPPKYQNKSWIYDDLTKFCKGEDLPKNLWRTWKLSRNLVFHWFPKEKRALSLPEAQERVGYVVDSIDNFFSECSVDLKLNE